MHRLNACCAIAMAAPFNNGPRTTWISLSDPCQRGGVKEKLVGCCVNGHRFGVFGSLVTFDLLSFVATEPDFSSDRKTVISNSFRIGVRTSRSVECRIVREWSVGKLKCSVLRMGVLKKKYEKIGRMRRWNRKSEIVCYFSYSQVDPCLLPSPPQINPVKVDRSVFFLSKIRR